MADVWSSGNSYEQYVGRWSRRVAREFIPWLGVAPQSRWLDIGCGTGALTATVLELSDPARVIAVDASSSYISHARMHVDDERARFAVSDAIALGRDDDEFDAVVSGLALNFFPDQPAALTEMRRVTRPGGTIAVYVWDYAEGIELMRVFWDVALELDPAHAELDEAARFPICQPDALAALWTDTGLIDVETRDITVPTVFHDFDDYWTPFLGGQGAAPAYAMTLSEEARAELRERLRDRLPYDESGAIPMTARAWAVKGTVPA